MEMYKQNNEYHCMSAMRRVFCIFSLLIILVGNAWGATSPTGKYILYYEDGFTSQNIQTFTDGCKLQITGNTEKKIQYGSVISVDGNSYKTLKLSNGAQNTLTMPDGIYATKLTFYSYMNTESSTKTSYWQEVAGINYDATSSGGAMTCYKGDLSNPDVRSYSLAEPMNSVTFTNKGEQLLYVIVVEWISPLSVGKDPATVTNDYIYDYDECNTKNGWPEDPYQLMDCVYSGGYVKFKIRPSVDGDYKLTSVIATEKSDRDVTITCNGQIIKNDIYNNGDWTDEKYSYEWTFTGLKAGTDYDVVISCTDPNPNNREYQVNVFDTTIQWVETTGGDSGSTVTPGGGTFNTNISSLTNQTSSNLNEETLGLNELTSAETFTVFRPTNNTDKFSNGAVITYFNDYYYCMWQSSALDEDSQDTWVAYSRSKDGKTWDAPKALVSDDKNNNVINTSGGWYVDKKNNKLIAYINNWTVSGWTDEKFTYKGNETTGKKIGNKQSLKTCYVSTTDGVTWTSPADVKMWNESTLDGIFEQDPYVTSSGRIINAAHFTSSLVPCPIYTDNTDGVTGWKKAKTFNIGSTGGMEPSVYQKPDGTTVMTFRTGDYKLASASTDNGDTWTDVAATNVPDAQTKQSAGNLPDGTSFLVGTPKKKSIATEDVTDWADANGNNYNTRQGLRKPLAILLSKDGTTFDIGYYLRKGKTDTDISSGPAYGGLYKRPGYHYAKSMVANGYLWISYATNKETVQVTRIPLSDISLNTFKGAGENARNIKLDFDNSKKKTHQDYVSWIVDTESSAEYTTTDAIKITVNANSDSAAKVLKGNRWGSAPTDNEGNLVGDGLTAYTSGTTKPTSGKVAIDVTITNLPAGTHTLQAYHNYVELNEGSVVPKINVAVNGQDVVTGVEQTLRKSTIGESAKSNVIFNVNDASDNTVITYYTTPENGVSYNCTGFFINSIEIDGTQVDNKVLNVYPKSLDFHTAHNNGNVILTWDAAPSGATKHVVYFGTDSTSVANGMCEATMVYDTSLEKYNLSPLKRYYWRVDEVIDGMAYEGEVQSFQPCRDAFPGAEGYGRDAIGGRGWNGNGEVYHVTSLKDDGSKGTFRYGIENAKVPTTIVFDVAGVIRLNSRLTNSNPYVTIAGQTAPGNGIMFRGAPFGMSSDGITRFMRLRLGSDAINGESGNDGMGINGDHSIMDHCSIGWTIDEAFSSRGAKNITLQHTLISEALNVAWHPNYANGNGHGYAATVGGDKGSLHHNLLAHNAGRNWSMGGGLDGAGYYKDYLDMFNNVCYNWVDRTTDGGVHVGKFVGNYYKMGPSSNKMQLIMAHIESVGEGTQQYYVKGNIRENYDGNIISQSTTLSPKGESGTEAIYTMRNDKESSYTADAFFDSESWEHYFDSRATVETARAAFKNVLSDVGCSLPILDNHDVRMIGETLNGTYSTIGSRKGTKGIIDNENDSGCEGFGGLNIVTAERRTGWDADQDGIPAWFETAMGWSDSDKNNNADSDGDYWTDLEEYLNWVAVPHFENMAVGEEHTIDLSAYFAGYGESVKFEITSNPNNVASISGSTLTVTPAKDMVLFTVKVKASESVGKTGNLEEETISLEREFNFYVGTVVADNIIESEIVEDTELVYYPKTTETIEWSLTEGNGKNNYEVSKGLSEYLKSASLTKGTYLSWSGTTTVANGTGTLVSANGSNGTSEDTKNSIVFNVQTKNGATLIPTKLSMYSSDTNSTGVKLDAKADNKNGETSSIMNNYTPGNTSKSWGIKYNNGQLTMSDNIDLNLYVLGASKSVGLRDVKITATLVHPSYSLLIMDEMAESNKLSNVTVKEGVDVKLIRNLTPNIWNTFCVPFDISEETIKSVWGEGTEVCEFTSVNGGNLHFTTVSAISAGTPCLIRPVNVAPSNRFQNVNVTQTEPKSVTHGSYSYVGTYTRYTMKTDGTELGLTSKNKLAKPKASPNNKMSGLRAFFRSVGGNSSNAKVIIGGELTSIDEIDGSTAGAKGVYHVSGRYVRSEWNNGSGLPRGLYIVNGQKMVK
ncbi:MAG: exo-alpha-sialidase [Prevotella sp.]|nr:exo-alpha-sialidase [Prevotella sp.]